MKFFNDTICEFLCSYMLQSLESFKSSFQLLFPASCWFHVYLYCRMTFILPTKYFSGVGGVWWCVLFSFLLLLWRHKHCFAAKYFFAVITSWKCEFFILFSHNCLQILFSEKNLFKIQSFINLCSGQFVGDKSCFKSVNFSINLWC